jgi:hypothetical protein
MRAFRHIGKLTWRCGCLVCHALNWCLVFLALSQSVFLGLNLFQKEIPFPDKFASWVLNELGTGKYKASWKKVVFDLRTGLLLSEFVLKDSTTDQIVATAGETRLEWTPLHLLFDNLAPFSEVDARDVRLYIPASISPSGLNEPVLFIHDASLQEVAGQLAIRSMLIQSGKIDLLLTGSAPLSLLKAGLETGHEPEILPLLQKLSRLPKGLSAEASLQWRMFPSGSHLFSVKVLLPELNYAGVDFSRLSAEARIRLKKGETAILDLGLHGQVQPGGLPAGLSLPSQLKPLSPVPFNLKADGPRRQLAGFAVPTAARLSLHPHHPSGLLDHLILKTNYWNASSPFHWNASSNRIFASGMAYPQPAGSPQRLPALSFRAYLSQPSLQSFIPDPPDSPRLENLHARYLRLNSRLDPASRLLSGSITCDGLFVANTFFANAHARDARLSPEFLDFPDIHARKAPNETATGSYFHHFPSSRFSLVAAGSTFPSSLDYLLGSWWVDIFTEIQAAQPLNGDVTVWGLWRDHSTLQSMTHAWGSGASYRGVEVPDLDVRVRSNAAWALVERLEGTFGEGRILGRVGIATDGLEKARLRAIQVELESDAPWEAVAAASGLDELNILTFEDNPHVEARGWIWQAIGEAAEADTLAALDLELLQHSGVCRLKGMEFAGLVLQGKVAGKSLEFEHLNGQFAEGVFAGNMRIGNWQDDTLREQEYEFHLFDADFSLAVEQLTSLMKNPDSVRGTLERESTGGRLDTLVKLKKGPLPAGASGRGSVWLRDARVGQIHLFGGLSRFLSSRGMGFSSLDLKTATLDWSIADEILLIENGLITGPALTLSLGGKVDLNREVLAMQAQVSFFEGLLSKILSPVSETLEFDLSGRLEEPDWEVRISPLRWFQRRMGSEPAPAGL